MTVFAMPRLGSVELSAERLVVHFGPGFGCDVPRTAITDARLEPTRTISLGAHGWRGRWLVNTSTRGLVTMTLDPEQRGRVLGVPVRLRELTVSLADPDAFLAELARSGP